MTVRTKPVQYYQLTVSPRNQKTTFLIVKTQYLMSVFKTRTAMADEYEIHRKTFERKLRRAGIILPPGDISPKFQQIIYEYFGLPPKLVSQLVPACTN